MTFEILTLFLAITELAQDGEPLRQMVQLALSVIVLVGLAGIFVKAKRAPLAAITPILAEITFLRLVDRPLWWLVLLLCPLLQFADPHRDSGLLAVTSVVAWVTQIVLFVLLSQRFGKGLGFYLGLVLLPFVFVPLLGFGAAGYAPVRRRRAEPGSQRPSR